MVGGCVFRQRGSFDQQHAPVFRVQLCFDEEQKLVANAAALALGIHGDPIEIVRAVGHGRGPETNIAVDAIFRVNGAIETIILLFGLIEIDVDQLERDADLNRREPVGGLQNALDVRPIFSAQGANRHLLLLVAMRTR